MLSTAISHCKNHIFQTASHRAMAEELITSHLGDAIAVFLRDLPDSNFYISGSLARQEPSLRYVDGKPVGLQSDIDFIVVGDATREQLTAIERRLNAEYPEFRDTLYGYRAEQIPHLRSASARDFYLGLAQPLHESFTVDLPKPFVVEQSHALEFLIYQIAQVLEQRSRTRTSRPELADPLQGMWNRDADYSLHKLAVEALRAATCVIENAFDRVITFQAVYENSGAFPFDTISSEMRINQLLREREMWTGSETLWSDEVGHIVHGAVSAIAGQAAAKPHEVLRTLEIQFYNTDQLVHLFPLAALVAFYACFESLKTPEIRELENDLLVRLSKAALVENTFPSLAEMLVTLRWDYLRVLIDLKDNRYSNQKRYD